MATLSIHSTAWLSLEIRIVYTHYGVDAVVSTLSRPQGYSQAWTPDHAIYLYTHTIFKSLSGWPEMVYQS